MVGESDPMHFRREAFLFGQQRAQQVRLNIELDEVNARAFRTARPEFKFEQRSHLIQGVLQRRGVEGRAGVDGAALDEMGFHAFGGTAGGRRAFIASGGDAEALARRGLEQVRSNRNVLGIARSLFDGRDQVAQREVDVEGLTTAFASEGIFDPIAEGLTVKLGEEAISIRGHQILGPRRSIFAGERSNDGIKQLQGVLGGGAGHATLVVAGEFAQANGAAIERKPEC